MFCQKCVVCCTRDPVDKQCHMLQCGGEPHSPAAHGRAVAPAARVEGDLAGVATRRVEARVEARVGERACSWTEVAPIEIVPCLRLQLQRTAHNSGYSRHRNNQLILHWRKSLLGGVQAEKKGVSSNVKIHFPKTSSAVSSFRQVKMLTLKIKQVLFRRSSVYEFFFSNIWNQCTSFMRL